MKVAETRRGSVAEDWVAREYDKEKEQNKAESESLDDDSSKISEAFSSKSSEKKKKSRMHKSDKQEGNAIYEEVREMFINENKLSRMGLSESEIIYIINSIIKHLKVDFLQVYVKGECKDKLFPFLL